MRALPLVLLLSLTLAASAVLDGCVAAQPQPQPQPQPEPAPPPVESRPSGTSLLVSASELQGLATGGRALVWAESATATSHLAGPGLYEPENATGAPDVWPAQRSAPKAAWAPRAVAGVESLELRFPPTQTERVLVVHTFGPDTILRIEDLSRGPPEALYEYAGWRDLPTAARALSVQLPAPRTITRLRVVLQPGEAGAGPSFAHRAAAVRVVTEIDAVALLGRPLVAEKKPTAARDAERWANYSGVSGAPRYDVPRCPRCNKEREREDDFYFCSHCGAQFGR